jgi:hypothetical protein
MENDLESEIHCLAYSFWQSAGRDFGQTALDFWAVAEQMVIELTADSARLATTAATSTLENMATWPLALRALYLYRVRELARCMWSASTEQRDRSMDYWLAAEKHLRLLTESVVCAAGASLGKEETIAKTFEMFSPVDYLEQIRKTAYQCWETAENQHNRRSTAGWRRRTGASKVVVDRVRRMRRNPILRNGREPSGYVSLTRPGRVPTAPRLRACKPPNGFD